MAAHLEAQLRVALQGFGQPVELGQRGLVEFGAGGVEEDVLQRHRVAQGEQVLGLPHRVDEGDGFGPRRSRHDEGVEVLLAVAAVAVAGEEGRAPVGRHDERGFVAGGVDGVSEVLHLAPGAVVHPLGHVEVGAAHAEVAVGGEVEGLVVEVDVGRGLVAFGIYRGAQVAGFAPAALFEGAVPDVGAAVAAAAVGGEVEGVAVDRERGERLPVAAVDRRAEVARLAPAVAAADAHVEVAARGLVVAAAGGEDDHAAVVREGLRPLVGVAVQGLGHPLGGAPVELHGVVEREVEVFLLRQVAAGGGAPRHAAREDQHAVVGRQGGHVLVGFAVDVGSQVDGSEGHGMLHGMLAPFGRADAVAGLLHPAAAGGVQVEALPVAVARRGILLQLHVLVAQQQIGFGIGGVQLDGLVQQLDGLLVLAHDALLHGLLKQRLALLVLPHRRQRQQKQQCY